MQFISLAYLSKNLCTHLNGNSLISNKQKQLKVSRSWVYYSSKKCKHIISMALVEMTCSTFNSIHFYDQVHF